MSSETTVEKSMVVQEKKFRGDLPGSTVPKLNVCRQQGTARCIVPEAIRANQKAQLEADRGTKGNGRKAAKEYQFPSPVKVMLIADKGVRSDTVSQALAQAPTRSFSLTLVPCMGDANRKLKRTEHDIVLIDLTDQQERECRQAYVISHFRRIHGHVPVVALSDTSTSDAILRGAQDCIAGDQLEAASLERAIEHAILRHDLTEQLRHANRLLDQKGGELRRANDLLRQKNGRLKRFYDMAQEFVDHVSHEFRTPLTVIKEYATILADGLVGPVTAKQREFLEIVDSRTDDLAYLVDDMLDVSRLRAGIIGVYRQDCSVADIFDRVRSVVEHRASRRGISISFDIQGTLPRIYCDPEKIGRVIVNLVVNAMKVCDEGQTIDVWAKAGDKSGEILIGVTDKGPGIAPKDRRRIFERFRQACQSGDGRLEGFGLGLSIARDLLALNFGELSLDSAMGEGTTFSFSLPCSNVKGLVDRYVQSLEKLEESPLPVSVLNVMTGSCDDKRRVHDLDRFLQSQTRRHDFVVRVTAERWLVFLQCGDADVSRAMRRWRDASAEFRGNRSDSLLPEFTFERRGTWTVPDESTGLLQALRPDYLTSARSTNDSCVLVVDDDRDFAKGLNLQLGAAGYAVKTAKDAESALRMASKLNPQAILLDHSLPGMNGIEALEELKRNPSTQDIPVIMLSANTTLQPAALAHNAKFYLKKPCGFDTIVSALRDVLV